jgi:hypothetical protein
VLVCRCGAPPPILCANAGVCSLEYAPFGTRHRRVAARQPAALSRRAGTAQPCGAAAAGGDALRRVRMLSLLTASILEKEQRIAEIMGHIQKLLAGRRA